MVSPTTIAAPRQLIYGLFKPECYDAFFVRHDFLNLPCLKLLLSKVLSYGILLGAIFVKIPQIINIVRSKSTIGLNPLMYILENFGYLISVVYNFRHSYPFSTFGESVFLLIQGFILVALFGYYNNRISSLFFGFPVFGAFAYYLYFIAPLDELALFQAGTIAIFASSRLPQIWSNFQQGNTGVLSVVTVTMNVAGNTARIFTTIQEVNDTVVLAQAVASWALNAIIFAQVIYYWKATNALKATGAAGKKESKKSK